MSVQTYPCDKCGRPIPQSSVVVSGDSVCWRCKLKTSDEPEEETVYDRDVRAIVVAMVGLPNRSPGYTWADLITDSEAIALEMQKQRNKRKGIEDR